MNKIKKSVFGIIILFGIVLSLNLVFVAGSSTTEIEFFNSFSDPYCYSQSLSSNWYEDNDVTNSMLSCYRVTGFPSSNCCPTEKWTKCEDNICVEGHQHCSEITDENICNDGLFTQLAKKDLETESIFGDRFCNSIGGRYGDSDCFEYTACDCGWVNGECQVLGEELIFNGTNFLTEDLEIFASCGDKGATGIGTCSFDFNIIDNCETIGFLDRNWIADFTGTKPLYCESGNDRIPCLDVVKLAFFSLRNIIIAVVIIAIIYVLMKRKKKK